MFCYLLLSRFWKWQKNKHLSLSDRYDIEKYLNQGFNFSEIGRLFSYLFQIILTDNDSEFIDPDPIEFNCEFPRANLFYCNPMQSQQKGKIEVAHEYIRRYIPKGTSFNNITQEKLTLICNHINSVPREKMLGMNAFKVQKCFCPEIFLKN